MENNTHKELKKSLLQRIPAKIHQPSNFFGWQFEAIKKQEIILDILKITEDPTHPQLYELYENVAKMAFLAYLDNLLDWALHSYRNSVAVYKNPLFIKMFQDLEKSLLSKLELRRMNPFLRMELDFDDDLFIE